MDSFLDEPRKLPKPAPVIQEVESPTVPEISLLFSNPKSTLTTTSDKYSRVKRSYNAWKLQQATNDSLNICDSFITTTTNNNNNNNNNTTGIGNILREERNLVYKKQVRFEGSPQQRTQFQQQQSRETKLPFERLYVSNIPSSVVPMPMAMPVPVVPKVVPPPPVLYNRQPEEMKQSEKPIRIENTCNNNITTTNNQSPSVNDLLAIIQVQNEQVQLLQTQVQQLLLLHHNKNDTVNEIKIVEEVKTIETPKYKDQQIGTSFESVEESTKKVSIGVMTSFEINVPKEKYKKQKQKQITPPVIRKKLKKKRKNVTANEYTFGSQTIVAPSTEPSSPDNSIHIDMQDYDDDDSSSNSDSNSNSDDSSDSDDEPATGWTFYKDVLGQVNNILGHTPPPSSSVPKKVHHPLLTNTTLDNMKRTTMKHLHKNGFMQLRENELLFKPNEISFAVKQILMKYVSDDRNNAPYGTTDTRNKRTKK